MTPEQIQSAGVAIMGIAAQIGFFVLMITLIKGNGSK